MSKGYYLMLDALIAAVILVIGYFMITLNFLDTGDQHFTENIASQVMSLLSTTRFTDLCSPACTIPGLQPIVDSGLKNKNLTLAEGLGELYSRDTDGNSIAAARRIIELVVVEPQLIPPTADFAVYLEANDPAHPALIYPIIYPYTGHVRNLFPAKKVIFGSYRGSIQYWGPYTLKLVVWEKAPVKTCDPAAPGTDEQKCGTSQICFRHDLREGPPFENAGVCVPSRGEPGQPCSLNSQCQQGNICNKDEGVCFDRYQGEPCTTEIDCGAGFVCEEQECIPTDGLPGNRCGFDNDCTRGSCKSIPAEGYGQDTGFCFGAYCKYAASSCTADADCTTGYLCSSGSCVNYCDSMFICGAGAVCQLDEGQPDYQTCQDTPGTAGSPCELDNDCGLQYACESGICALGYPQDDGTPCRAADGCGPGSVCTAGFCRDAVPGAHPRCDGDSDCPAGLECLQFNEFESRCYATNTCQNSPCTSDATGKFECGPGYYCDISQGKCIYTPGDRCDFASDCQAGFNCITSACVPEDPAAARCGDGNVDLNEQCEAGQTTTCGALGCTTSQNAFVPCNPPGSFAQCRWNKANCDLEFCPACRFPADCNEDCQLTAEELNTLVVQRRIFTIYDCKANCPVQPTGQLMSCAFDLGSSQGYDPYINQRYQDPYTLEPACTSIPQCFT